MSSRVTARRKCCDVNAAVFLAFPLLLFLLPCQTMAYPAEDLTGNCTVGPCFTYQIQAGGAPVRSSPAAACAEYARLESGQPPPAGRWVVSVVSSTEDICTTLWLDYRFGADGTYQARITKRHADPTPPVYSCPRGGTLSGANCIEAANPGRKSGRQRTYRPAPTPN